MVSSRKLSAICYSVSLLVFLLIFLWGKFGSITGNEMGFVLLNFYVAAPVVFFATALLLGIKNAYMKWLYPLFAGILAYAVLFLLFGTSDAIFLCFSLIPAAIGLGVGMLVRKLRVKQ